MRPPLAVERAAGRAHGGIDLGRAGLVHQADQAVVDRRPVLEGLRAGDELAADEVHELLHRALLRSARSGSSR
jgi:hypothetical protein